jgi:hypothetical protein
MNSDGRLVGFGKSPSDYKTDVMARRIEAIVRAQARTRQPLLLWAAFLAPHPGGTATRSVIR